MFGLPHDKFNDNGPEFKSAKHCNQNQRRNILFRYTLEQKKEFKFNVTNRVDLA